MGKVIALLLIASACFATAYTSSQSGNWSNASTWGGGGFPVSGDTATIANTHTVTVASTATVGTYTSDADSIALTLGQTGKLVVSSGIGFTLRGGVLLTFQYNNFTEAINMQAGSTWTWDCPIGFPYYMRGSGPDMDRFITFAGTSGSHVAVTSNPAGSYGYFGDVALVGGWSGLNVHADYTDFSKLGSSAAWFWRTDYGWKVELSNCTFNAVGVPFWKMNTLDRINSLPTNFSLNGVQFTGSVLHDSPNAYVYIYMQPTDGAATRNISQTYFDVLVSGSYRGVTLADVVFAGGFDAFVDLNLWTLGARLVIVNDSGTTTSQIPGPVTNMYLAMNNTTFNRHYAQIPNGLTSGDITWDGVILHQIGNNTAHENDGLLVAVGSAAGSYTFRVKNSIVLPTSVGTNSSANLVPWGLNAKPGNIYLEHNTVMGGDSVDQNALAFLHPEQAEGIGRFKSYKSNLYWDLSARGYPVSDLGGLFGAPQTDLIAGADISYNASYNAATASRTGAGNGTPYNILLSASPGANDVNVNPNFVDRTRNIETWSTARGGAGTLSSALSILKQDLATNVGAMFTWVRAGFAPTNALLRTAAHDGTTIGAVPFTAPSSSGLSRIFGMYNLDSLN